MTTASHFSLLVVDDEPDLRTLYELTLLREGYDMDTAGTVQEALLHLKDRIYSAVITDMRLPDGSGLDVLRWLEESGRREKAIVITAYGSAENAVEALKAGAYDYLTKPVDLKQFRAVVASALGRGGPHGPVVVPANLPSENRPRQATARRGGGVAGCRSKPGTGADGRPLGDDAARALDGRKGGTQHGAGPRQRRVGHRQGAGRPRDPRDQHARSPTVHRRQLQRDPGAVAGGRVLRLSQGSVHRRCR
jgi:ActR/RegA family two-component response regulator